MNRLTQGLVITLVGGAALRISLFSTTYTNYVKPGFRPYLVAAGICMVVLGAIRVLGEWRGAGSAASDHDREHQHGPSVAWLLCLPVLAIFVIAPPALGAYAAGRAAGRSVAPPAPVEPYFPLAADKVTDMTMGEFVGRAWGEPTSLRGHRVRLTGFVAAGDKGVWYVGRMQMACCAADAVAFTVRVQGAARPPVNTWIKVTGSFILPKTGKLPKGTVAPELAADDVESVAEPADPYE